MNGVEGVIIEREDEAHSGARFMELEHALKVAKIKLG